MAEEPKVEGVTQGTASATQGAPKQEAPAAKPDAPKQDAQGAPVPDKEGGDTLASKDSSGDGKTTDDSGGQKGSPNVGDYKLPEGMPREVAEFAKNNNLTQEQLDNTLKEFSGYLERSQQGQQQKLRAMGEEHVKTWGDEADANLSLVRRALKQNDPEGRLAQALDVTGFGNHPAVLDFFLTLGKSMREGGFLKAASRTPPGQKTAAQSMFSNHPSSQSTN